MEKQEVIGKNLEGISLGGMERTKVRMQESTEYVDGVMSGAVDADWER